MAEIKARRVVRPVPAKGIESVPGGTILVDGHLDYIDDGKELAPADAKYVATMDEAGEIAVVTDTFDPLVMIDSGKTDAKGDAVMEAAPNTSRHTFAGWPMPGEVIAEVIAEVLV